MTAVALLAVQKPTCIYERFKTGCHSLSNRSAGSYYNEFALRKLNVSSHPGLLSPGMVEVIIIVMNKNCLEII